MKKNKVCYNTFSTTFISEPGQDWKIAALRINERVCYFYGVKFMKEKFMNEAIEESLKSLEFNDIPVGAIIVKDGQIISRAYNSCEKNNCIHGHAEIEVINKAIKTIGNSYLDDCEMYITMEPCLMCYGAIVKTNIKKVYYAIANDKYGFSKFINYMPKIEFESGICKERVKIILNDFFKNKRN